MWSPQFFAQITAVPDLTSPLTIMAAVAFGVWLMTKRKDEQAHQIIVTDRNTSDRREVADATRLDAAFALIATLTAAQAESHKVQVAQAAELGSLRNAVNALQKDLTECRAENVRLRELLAVADAKVLVGERAVIERDTLKSKLEMAEERLAALLAANRAVGNDMPDDSERTDSLPT